MAKCSNISRLLLSTIVYISDLNSVSHGVYLIYVMFIEKVQYTQPWCEDLEGRPYTEYSPSIMKS